MDVMDTLGQRIREVIEASGKSQKELAAAMDLHRNALGAWMRDARNPTLDSLQRFADATGATVIVDLDHPSSPRRRITASPEVAELVPQVEALPPDRRALLAEVACVIGDLTARELIMLQSLVAQLGAGAGTEAPAPLAPVPAIASGTGRR